MIDSGALGNILSFRAMYLHSGSVDPMTHGLKLEKSMGDGVLADLGPIMDLIYHLLGEYKVLHTI